MRYDSNDFSESKTPMAQSGQQVELTPCRDLI
jgi:hypothetical protein